MYDSNNDVTMRLSFYRTCAMVEGECVRVGEDECFVFTIVALRLRNGFDIEPYGSTVWVRPDLIEIGEGEGGEFDGVFVVLDLPINSSGGLGYPEDLQSGDLLAFEIATALNFKDPNFLWDDGGRYQLLGVELFESEGSSLQGATLFDYEELITCVGD